MDTLIKFSKIIKLIIFFYFFSFLTLFSIGAISHEIRPSIADYKIEENILYFDIDSNRRSNILKKQTPKNAIYPLEIKLDNIHFFESYKNRFRVVTHSGINESDVERLIQSLKKIVE